MAKKDRLQISFGRRCRELRHEKGLSQIDMVRHKEFDLSHYQKVERGNLDPRLSTLKKLADAFGVNLSTLMDGVP